MKACEFNEVVFCHIDLLSIATKWYTREFGPLVLQSFSQHQDLQGGFLHCLHLPSYVVCTCLLTMFHSGERGCCSVINFHVKPEHVARNVVVLGTVGPTPRSNSHLKIITLSVGLALLEFQILVLVNYLWSGANKRILLQLVKSNLHSKQSS